MFTIRNASLQDIPLIRQLTLQVWPNTYAGLLSQEQINYMLDMMYSEPSLQKQIQGGSQFIFVYENEQPVGFAAYFLKEPSIFKLDKIYILPSQQGKGTGRFVIDHIISQIKNQSATALQLQVKRDNKAKSFYDKLGFVIVKEIKLDIGNGYFMDDYIMELSL